MYIIAAAFIDVLIRDDSERAYVGKRRRIGQPTVIYVTRSTTALPAGDNRSPSASESCVFHR